MKPLKPGKLYVSKVDHSYRMGPLPFRAFSEKEKIHKGDVLLFVKREMDTSIPVLYAYTFLSPGGKVVGIYCKDDAEVFLHFLE